MPPPLRLDTLAGPPLRRAAPPVTWTWAAALAVSALVLLLAVSPPWVPTSLGAEVLRGFRTLCHQMPSRSFHVHGVAFAVCHRCTGLYAGVAAGVLVWPLVRTWVEGAVAPRLRAVLVASVIPLGIDWGLTFIGLWENTVVTQTATGALAGVVAGLLLARGLAPRGERVPGVVTSRIGAP